MADATGGWPSEPRQPRSGKSTAAFRTISEVSGELAVPQHVLRFWETKFAQVRPMKRAGGRRYYRPEDVALLRTIRELLYRDGFTIRGAQKFLRDGGVKGMGPATAAAAEARREAVAFSDGQARAERAGGEPALAAARAEPLASPAAAAPPAASAAPPAERAALKAVLEELETLRELLRRRLG
jgi:DNA-binding transcriptional MerR regulator